VGLIVVRDGAQWCAEGDVHGLEARVTLGVRDTAGGRLWHTMLGRSARHLYLRGALRARVVLARSALLEMGKKLGEMEKNNFQFWDFVFWRAARQGAAGAQRGVYERFWRIGTTNPYSSRIAADEPIASSKPGRAAFSRGNSVFACSYNGSSPTIEAGKTATND